MSIGNIERDVQSKVKVNFRTLELVLAEPGVATFARSRSMKFALAMAVVVGLALIVGCPLFLVYFKFFEVFGREIVVFLVVFELISSAVVTLAVIVHFHGRPLVFDKNQGRMWRRGKIDPGIGDYASLRDVEGVQVCSAMVSDSEGDSYRVYELDVVMKRPAGVRVPAICHANRGALFADANNLAEFLGVPLLDHTDELSQGKCPSRR